MENKKPYRSAIRSKRLIHEAFLAILKEKQLERITVTDIVARADINRSTFYAHYPDVHGLIEEIEDEAVSGSIALLKELENDSFFQNPKLFVRALIKPLTENKELYTLMGRSDYALNQLEKLKIALTDQVIHSPHVPNSIRDSSHFEIRIQFFIGGIINVYRQWLQGNLECNLDDICDVIAELIQAASEDLAIYSTNT